MPRQNPTTAAGRSVAPSSSIPGEQSRVGQSQRRVGQSQRPQTQDLHRQGQYQPIQQSRVGQSHYAASHQTGQFTQYQSTQFPTRELGQITKQHQPTTTHHAHRHIQAVQHQPSQSDAQYLNAGSRDGFITKNERQLPGIKKYKYPNPGPPDRYLKENGRMIPSWFNPPGIVGVEMDADARAEYDRDRRRIVNSHR